MLDDILKALLGGNQANENQSGNPLLDLLQGVLGGSSAENASSSETAASEFGLDDILNVVLSGGGDSDAAAGNNPLLEPMVQLLSDELGLKPDVARQVMSAVVTLVVGWMKQRQEATPDATAEPLAGLDLGNLLTQNRSQTEAVASRLAAQTELSEAEAVNKMESALRLLAGRSDSDDGERGFG